ncbi:Response regulator MprA [Thalassocella blandensis]|nr:Response regulator MprA [Thalassocella blandensis]
MAKNSVVDKPVKPYFTTGEVANYCGVTLRTVINWIKQGRLPAHQLPGTRKDNRISRQDLCSFMQLNGLPLPPDLDQSEAEPPLQAVQDTKTKIQALVVDDDVSMAKAIGRVLRSAGMQVLFAHDGFEAGRMYEKHQPALITLDLNMPKMDGFAVLDALRDRQGSKILVLSALGDTYMQQALDKKADAVMSKPFDNEVLLQKLQHLLTNDETRS